MNTKEITVSLNGPAVDVPRQSSWLLLLLVPAVQPASALLQLMCPLRGCATHSAMPFYVKHLPSLLCTLVTYCIALLFEKNRTWFWFG